MPGVGAMLLQNRWHYAHDTHMKTESIMLLVQGQRSTVLKNYNGHILLSEMLQK